MKYDFRAYVKAPLPFEKKILKYFDRQSALTIFEIGSCEGEDSIRLKRLFPNSTIYTFEPLASNIKIIKKHFKEFGLSDSNVYQVALSDKSGTSTFHVSSGEPSHISENEKSDDWNFGNKSSSLLAPKEHKKILNWIEFNEKIKVKTETLERFCSKHSLVKIDFAYIDVQGAEMMVLKGAGKMLKNIKCVWLEVEVVELYANQPLKKDVEKFMIDNGFLKVMDTVDSVSGDQLYVHKSLKKQGPRVTKLIRNMVR